LFQRGKEEELVGLRLDQDSLKMAWQDVTRGIVSEFATTFSRRYQVKKCIQIGCGNVKLINTCIYQSNLNWC
jgi:hypothetical protein